MLNLNQPPAAPTPSIAPRPASQIVPGTGIVSVINTEQMPWFYIGFRFGFGFLFAALLFGAALGVLYAILQSITH